VTQKVKHTITSKHFLSITAGNQYSRSSSGRPSANFFLPIGAGRGVLNAPCCKLEICNRISIRQEDVSNKNLPEKRSDRKTGVKMSEQQALQLEKPVIALALNRKR
jgi:hypothetical protein